MTGAGDGEQVEIASHDRPVEVRMDEGQSRSGAPVPEQPRLHVVRLQRDAKQRVVHQIDLADAEIVGGPPPRVDRPQLLARSEEHASELQSLISISYAVF